MKPVAAREMRRLDEAAIKDFGIPSLILMENAGRGVSEIIEREHKPCRVAVVVGKGNNGGDGLVAARYLANSSFQVSILLLEDPKSFKEDPSVNYRIVQKMKIPVKRIPEDISVSGISSFLSEAELIVDAIFGTGLGSDVCGVFEAAVNGIFLAKRTVISIDIPSGLDADCGRVHGTAVKASITATLGLPKKGLLEGRGPEYAGRIEVVDIGIPRVLLSPYLD